MKTTEITVLEEVELDNPIFIEALPGLGHVGKLAADHMIDELGATKFAEIYSPTFPPQVLVKDEGVIENMFNELYYLRDVGEDNLDLIILVGNTQSLSPEGTEQAERNHGHGGLQRVLRLVLRRNPGLRSVAGQIPRGEAGSSLWHQRPAFSWSSLVPDLGAHW